MLTAWKRQASVTESKINPKLSLYESVVESSASPLPLPATIAAVALAPTEATMVMIVYGKC